jgi:hypothetical protein
MTVGSFGMNIYTVITKVQEHDQAMADLRNMRDRYNRENPIYDCAINGASDDTQLKAVADFFGISISDDDTKAALKKGYNGILGDYENTLQNLLSGPEEQGIREGGFDGAYTAMISKFKENAVDGADTSVITGLENSYKNFKTLKQIALDKTKASEVRKNGGLDKIRDEFNNSIGHQMNLILETINIQIHDHNSLNILVQSARKLVPESKPVPDQNVIDALVAQLKQSTPGLPDDIYLKLAQTAAVPNPETLIKPEATSAFSVLNITSPKRSKFKTPEEVEEAIRKLVKEFQAKRS